MLRDLMLVGVGGFVGSVARFLVGGWVTQLSAASRFPVGTLAVNAIGCLLIGAIAGYTEHTNALSPHTRLLVFTGILGGFTTFSAFAFETWFLAREHAWLLAGTTVITQVVVALGAVWVGHSAAQIALR
ncbi:MAG: fluoride efflux transporter CrcB [Gemmatimonadetes bacterium]|nr:fluoride efflux transporter CrcB [Gemmatimonadota bacterium]